MTVSRRAVRRSLAAAALVVIGVIGVAGPAGADPARPTDYESTVAKVSPPTSAATVKVVGGDGFLDLDVKPGHTVVVEGYRGEPFLRVLEDGTVQENTNSPATYLNRSRRGTTAVPPELQGDTLPAPKWRTIGHDGHAVWHDHRIHFMGTDTSAIAGLADGRPVPWTVNFTVDGVPTVASGSYRLHTAPSALPWLVVMAALAAAVALLGRRSPVTVAAIAVVGAGAIGVVVGVEQNAAIPAGAGATPLTVVLPALALLAGVLGLVKRGAPSGAIAVLAGVACAGGWVVSRASVLWKAVLPTDLAPVLDRAGTAIVVGLAVGAAILVVRSGALASPASARRTGASRPTPQPGSGPAPEPA